MSQVGELSTASSIGTVTSLEGNTGGVVDPNGSGTIFVLGSGDITVTGNPGTNTLTITSTGGLLWNDITGTSAAMAINNGYLSDNAALVTLTLPATAAQFSVVAVAGTGAGGWLIAQNAGQSIQFGSAAASTTGVSGSLSSTNRYDAVYLLCTVANTNWLVLNAVGNLTVV